MKNYYPYIITNNNEWVSQEPMDLNTAYDVSVRMKNERNATEAGVKVFTQECVKIISWHEGRYWHGKGSYLYKIIV